jgi:hypothetical protein
MITTGNLYIQIYDLGQNKYIELPFNELGIRSYIRSGAYPITGFLYHKSLIVNDKLEMAAIDLGKYNKTSGTANNIGMGNRIFAISGTPPNYSSFNLGNLNYLASGYSSFNFGNFNTTISNDNSFNFGSNNSITPSNSPLNQYQYVFGNDNTIQSTGDSNYVIGKSNNLNFIIIDSKIIGDTNTINTGQNIKLIGDGNSITESEYIDSFGDSNIFANSNQIISVGDSNSTSYSTGIFNIAKSTTTENSQNVLLFGNNNTAINNQGSIILGLDNSASGSSQATILGVGNNIVSQVDLRSTVIGYYNELNNGASNTQILGDYNYTSGTSENSYLLGDNNDIISSSDNFAYGSYNLIKNSNFINNIGSSNQVDKSYNNSIFGNYNVLSSGSYCSIIGENNSVSGLKNYVFGNNNTIRSGDYNSILIGISHEFTGDYKAGSVNIASVDSNIEVSSSEIKLTSPSRAKFNNENIVINSDLNSYLNSSNGLVSSGEFTSFIIYDPNYTSLADQIELQSFGYSGKEDRYYGGFSGYNSADLNAYNFTGFFRKQSALYYGGLHSIYGDYYYQSNNENFEILFSRDIEGVTGNWIISPKNSPGLLFYNKSANTGVFPVSNWITTGSLFVDISQTTGYSPAPSFTYSSSFSGFFHKQKINNSVSYTSNYFNNFGSATYPSSLGEDIAVIYGNHTNSQFDPTWLIIDKYSSGVYYINNSIANTTTPQTGWVVTGYMGYSGRNMGMPNNIINNSGIKISLGTRTGIISSYDQAFGTIYIPFFY